MGADKGWRADCFRSSMAAFDEAYAKACSSSQPDDWMHAALLAQQFRNVAYAVLTGEAPKQEPPASVGWTLVPREPTAEMVQAGGQMLPPSHSLTDCYEYFREAWAQALEARPIYPSLTQTENARLREALERIAKGQTTTFDEVEGYEVVAWIGEEEMSEIARAALSSPVPSPSPVGGN